MVILWEILKTPLNRVRAAWETRDAKDRLLLIWELLVEIVALIWLINGFSFKPIVPVYQWY